MTDIVKRLRSNKVTLVGDMTAGLFIRDAMLNAADEIEQLRAALRAQVDVSTIFAKRIGLDDQAIADCTAQANAALNIQERTK